MSEMVSGPDFAEEMMLYAGAQLDAAVAAVAPRWMQMSAPEAVDALESEMRADLRTTFTLGEPEVEEVLATIPERDPDERRAALIFLSASLAVLRANGLERLLAAAAA
jgi:hypothetical protein